MVSHHLWRVVLGLTDSLWGPLLAEICRLQDASAHRQGVVSQKWWTTAVVHAAGPVVSVGGGDGMTGNNEIAPVPDHMRLRSSHTTSLRGSAAGPAEPATVALQSCLFS